MTTWVKVYNSMPTNPKVLMAGDRAAWLAVCGLCYSNEHLTNGFIARHALAVVAPGVKGPEKLAAALVKAGLWHVEDGGWRIHDYGEHQRSADEIRERRTKDSARKASERSARSPHGQIADSARTNRGVQPDSHARDRARSQEVEGREQSREQKNINAELRSAVRESFAYWQEQCGHQQAHLSPDRASKVEARLRERQRHHDGDLHAAVLDVRQAVDGAARAPFVNDAGKRFDDIELICRNGSKLEDFMGRASSPERGANVTPLRRSPVLEHADRWQRHYPNRQEGSA